MKTVIIRYPDDEIKYRRFYQNMTIPLAQHSWEWQCVIANWPTIEWSALALLDCVGEIEACIPFGCISNSIGKIIMSSPLPASYGGVLLSKKANPEHCYKRLLTELIEYAKKNGIDLISIFTSPFREDYHMYKEYFMHDYELLKTYQYIDINKNEVENLMNRNIKRNLKKSLQNNLIFFQTQNPSKDLIDEWYNKVVLPRFYNKGANIPDIKLFYLIASYLKDSGMFKFSYIRKNKEMVSGGVNLYGWSEDIYLRVSNQNGLELGAGVLFDYLSIKDGEYSNISYINFQSSPTRDSTSFKYKQQWGCQENPCYYLVKVITDVRKFTKINIDMILKQFPYFFVLPYDVWNNSNSI
ncbi:hypothetical protein SAMN02745120_2583 [Acetoanaerobium noterae]|uniref:Acetyltransferase (GNAT) domain-containing protein n=1 Tax=Acetoanaerobium noterae TaxID=745369 RepID=A0A1T5D6E7_9FIRM|nr:hypothetical protein [Acetoanaerobium noterae]SKB67177.1 hypothetical protein SAMN02745120_2583 [Acetoanaerobium noterae]